ncbi:tyrosine-type recombinase/integrase [Brevibacillus centrosporus]|uniref:Site-specific recombinase XerD n=1 Tax=Brevibacillus centrosporus TaxID=54910 RepID=A0A1I4E1N6_9BACL|nr:tyrosine-type recombinase/integrase [Brevibacillus centrosporus]SFK99672.1 Site-specific recombinase XerD [Brevibacillus centrosporus]
MNLLLKEIDDFILSSKVIPRTRKRYLEDLHKFTIFLSRITGESSSEIHLEKIYILKDIKGKIYSYKPINYLLIDEFLLECLSKSYSYLYKAKCTLGSFFRYLERRYHFDNPMKEIKTKLRDSKPEKTKIIVLSRQQVLKFLYVMVKFSENFIRDLLLFTLLITTGCRVSEILNLKVSDFNVHTNFFRCWMSKTKRERLVVLLPEVFNLVKYFASLNNYSDDDYLFFSESSHAVLKTSDTTVLFHNYLDKAGLPKARVHSLRHLFAVLMYEAGSELPIIQQLLGHENMSSTEIYLKSHVVRNYNMIIKQNESVFSFYNKRKKQRGNQI